MDDLKVYTKEWDQLLKAKTGIENIAGAIGLRLNPKKCAIKSINYTDEDSRGSINRISEIPIMGNNTLYKYLGAEQNTLNEIEEMWTRAESSALSITRAIMASELTVRQKIEAYNQMVIPKIRFVISCIIFGKGKYATVKKKAKTLDTRSKATY
ncbi:hypothetical protein OESDEN_23825 [Oesophagostomum dentatum]|uniref:Reverse transcriptase domain-containing protein n=1 Tax=Oesophagostomum dentatum TaxID=61180 RepID=A0A0B1S016_OESDE|nr:hypothetical protein OESDEN_23825 [Oesophagostomum dentatum]